MAQNLSAHMWDACPRAFLVWGPVHGRTTRARSGRGSPVQTLRPAALCAAQARAWYGTLTRVIWPEGGLCAPYA
ncbi:hypothetical protein L484_011036 [Morus notabilis]|uniref:Uncharacterized protein n=1 Tax=Morus notabilis TaxID=981085 RepID=W9S1H6_9ROSA|nr:hypothetical protein L484_011036 [Morus notabilis]